MHLVLKYKQSTGGGVIVEKRKPGRPKIKDPKNKRISFPVTENELKRAQEISYQNDITYAEIFFKGLENWSDQK